MLVDANRDSIPAVNHFAAQGLGEWERAGEVVQVALELRVRALGERDPLVANTEVCVHVQAPDQQVETPAGISMLSLKLSTCCIRCHTVCGSSCILYGRTK